MTTFIQGIKHKKLNLSSFSNLQKGVEKEEKQEPPKEEKEEKVENKEE